MQSFKTRFIISLGFSVIIFLIPTIILASANLQLDYKDNKLSLHSEQASLFSILESFQDKTGMQVFIYENISPQSISLSFSELPLRQGIKRILRNYSYALLYKQDGDAWKPIKLRIYPKDMRGGILKPLEENAEQQLSASGKERTKTVLVRSGQEEVTIHNSIQDKGILAPSSTEVHSSEKVQEIANQHWFVLQQQAEAVEAKHFRELHLLQKKIQGADDAQKKEALAAAYAKKMEDFHELKRSNRNMIESIKRLQEHMQLTQGQKQNN